jgi:GT2 family glycosyltransferase
VGEIFKRERASESIRFSGERQVEEALLVQQRKNLGEEYLHFSVQIAIGIVSFNNDIRELARLFSSIQVALECAKIDNASIYLIDNGAPTDPALLKKYNIYQLESQGNIGFGAGHNRLMQQSFAAGAELYIATNPDGAFHPDALKFIVAMNIAQAGNSLIEAMQFPEEHPKIYDVSSFDTPWASGACLAIPREIYKALDGFDESFFMYCEDVDFSWRARANGFSVKICPRALFFHATTNRAPSESTRLMELRAGLTLAQKWGSLDFERSTTQTLKKMNLYRENENHERVDTAWRSIADFNNFFSFAETRW